MKKRYRQAVLLALLCLAPVGCEKEDPEHLSNLAKKVAARAEPVVSNLDAQWLQRFHPTAERSQPALPPVAVPIAEPDAVARVTSRLRYEKSLGGTSIQVVANEGALELKGKVQNVAQKKRAVELAESTTGVDRVTESLEVDDKLP
ncbi:hypothetical protein BH10PLA2_BH10PLA2_02290 [soil metagenome]